MANDNVDKSHIVAINSEKLTEENVLDVHTRLYADLKIGKIHKR